MGMKIVGRERRKLRIRKRVNGTSERPRLSVFRSARHIYAQVIDDTSGKTLAAASTLSKDLEGKLDVTIAALSGVLIVITVAVMVLMERFTGLSRRLASCRRRRTCAAPTTSRSASSRTASPAVPSSSRRSTIW